jgi:hypothetical protein
MILLHRITPFVIATLLAAGMLFVSYNPMSAIWALITVTILALALFFRLAGARFRDKEFWGLVAIPTLYILATILLFMLADDTAIRYLVIILGAGVTYFYAENLFTYLHLPGAYQAYSLQNSGGIMAVVTLFFLAAGGYALYAFARIPLYVFAAAFAMLCFILTLSALWISKIPVHRAAVYALAAAVMFAELLAVITYLPTVYVTDGALVAVLYYMYLGLSRANLSSKLSKTVIRRYITVGSLMVVAILLTAQWT